MELIRAEEGQLVIAQAVQEEFINFENQRKLIDKQEKELKAKLYEVMRANNITGYESNDKRIKISLSEDGITETIDKEKLFMEYPEAYRECIKESPRKGALRITIRENKDE